MKNKGFTLMELLIVIGVLGILAAGLLAAIDPFEQLKKARDTNNRSAAIEFLQASQRYYANHGYLPWRATASACVTAVADKLAVTPAPASTEADMVPVGVDQDTDINTCLDDLVADGELKTTFSQGVNTTLYLSSWSKTDVRVCFAPESKSNRNDANTQFNLVEGTPDLLAIGCSAVQKEDGLCLQCFQ